MKIFKIIVPIILTVLGLWGCSDSNNEATVTPKSSSKDITSVSFAALSPSVAGTISGSSITATVPNGTDITNLVPTIGVSDKATVSPASGSPQNYTNPVTYTVTAEDGSTKTYSLTVTIQKPSYQISIDAKFTSLGWDKDGHSKFNNSNPVKTAGGKGYVQYYAYGSRKTAIYYFEGKGAFAMDTEEMIAYDNAGQDNWGLVVSDPKATITGGCGYNDIITSDGKEAIITCQNLVYGNVYAKYKEMNRWNGPLGLPTSSEIDTPAANPPYAKGRYNSFQNGTIWSFNTGTYALWGRLLKLYSLQDWERGWLKLPTESCDPNKADNKQFVRFQGGNIDGADCGSYFSTTGVPLLVNGQAGSPPCY